MKLRKRLKNESFNLTEYRENKINEIGTFFIKDIYQRHECVWGTIFLLF